MEPVSVDIMRKVNGKSVPGKKVYGEKVEVDSLVETLLKDKPYYEESGGGVTFSGGEPLMQPLGLRQLLEGCKMHDLHTTIDTSGYAGWEQFEEILPLTDLFLYDLKHMDPELHKRYTGADNRPVLENASRLLEKGARVIFRIPVIPGINTTAAELDRMIAFLRERADQMNEVHLLPFHHIAENKYRRLHMKQPLEGLEEPDRAMMRRLQKKFKQTGLEVVIGG